MREERPLEHKQGNPKIREGIVVSDKMNKTVTVAVQRAFPHPVYQKIIRRTTRVLAHDEQNECNVGDRVRLMETRPLSRHKRWRVSEIITRVR